MATELPRICIEQRDDVAFVQREIAANVAKVAAAEAAEAEKVVARVFRCAANNLAVNGLVGLDAIDAPAEEFEPFDDSLRVRRESLLLHLVEVRERVAKKRIDAPLALMQKQTEALLRRRQRDTELAESMAHEITTCPPSVLSLKQTADWLSSQALDLSKDVAVAEKTLEDTKATVSTTKTQWKNARVVVGDFCSAAATNTLSSASQSTSIQHQHKEQQQFNSSAPALGTPSKMKVLKGGIEKSSELTPRKARAGLLKLLH